MRFYARKRRVPFINIVSMVDILAILLIFFIVTTTFRRKQPELVIDLPESRTAAAGQSADAPIVVSVGEGEEIFVDGAPVVLADLAGELRAAREREPSRRVAMQADRRVAFGAIVRVLDALREAGVKNLPAFTRGKSEP